MPRLKKVAGWMCESDYERRRGYSFLHLQKRLPQVDTDYKCYPIWVIERSLEATVKKAEGNK